MLSFVLTIKPLVKLFFITVPSQCFLAKNLTNKGLMSIATKVMVQINAKLGGEPWSVIIPVKVWRIR